jgi:flagellar assembly factor FliW
VTAVLPETLLPELTVLGGLAGFPDSDRYALVEVPETAPLFLLRSLDEAGLEFVVVPPHVFFPDYAPELDDASVERLGLTDPGDALLLVVLTLGERVEDATANLLAPIVISQSQHRAAQVVLQGDWSLRAPLHRS